MGKKPKKSRSNRPSFFKVLIGDFSKKLRVPPAFIEHFNGILPCKCILRSPTGRSWIVKVKRVGNDLFFHNGWQAFVNCHSLEFGDFLVFRYNGNSKFNVKIYGRNACEKDVPLAKNDNDEPISYVEKEKQGKAMAKFVRYSFQLKHQKRIRKEKADLRGKSCGYVKPKRVPAIETEALEEARSFKTERPHFIAIWRHSRRSHMTVPRALAIENGLRTRKSTVLRDPHRRSWTVSITIRKDRRIDLTEGWAGFWEANSLELGDACLFEFIRRIGDVIRVHIFRVAKLENPLDKCTPVKNGPIMDIPVSKRSLHYKESTSSRRVTTQEQERATKVLRAFKSKNPFFMVIMRPSYLYGKNFLNVPFQFAKSYLKEQLHSVTLRVSDRRTWHVHCVFGHYHRFKLLKGWDAFVSDNYLEVGDVCIFELVRRSRIELKVFIFRAREDPTLLPSGDTHILE